MMQFLISHGLLFLFAAVLVAQIGIPLPALPWLLAAGALSATGKLNFALCVLFTAMGCLVADSFWFFLGRIRGPKVMGWLCRISLEPDSCVRRTHNNFTRYGLWGLLISKFVPGLNTVVQPLAGMSGTPYARFAGVDAMGSILYGSVVIGLGGVFGNQITQVGAIMVQIGGAAVALLVGLAALYVGLKYWQRKHALHRLRMQRITASELRRKIEAGEKPAIFDLRSRAELQHDPTMIQGAVHLALEEMERNVHLLPRDREIVVYCSCPNEVTSARVALFLRRNGFTQIHPLQGGLAAWRSENLPTEVYALPKTTTATSSVPVPTAAPAPEPVSKN